VSQLVSSQLWWQGPEWLSKDSSKWPETRNKVDNVGSLDEKECELKQVISFGANIHIFPQVIDTSRFQKYSILIRSLAYACKFIDMLQNKVPLSDLSIADWGKAEILIIKQIQAVHFSEEIACIRSGRSLSKSSVLIKYSPYLDAEGVLRVQGRLECSRLLTHEQKHPIILPKIDKFTELLIQHEHKRLNHSQTTTVLASLRERFWIINGRQIIKSVIHRCVLCRRLFGKVGTQVEAPLPHDGIDEPEEGDNAPFYTSGVDFCGPFHVKIKRTVEKIYVALFTCAITRAVHLEVVSDLSTKKFLMSLRRFCSRRGLVKTLYSDNARTLERAAKDIAHLFNMVNDTEVSAYLVSQKTEWKFICPRSPWWGGFYERLMRSIKNSMRAVLGNSLVTIEEFQTVLCETEALLNSRPLTRVGTDPEEALCLTPAHFLIGKNLTTLPPGGKLSDDKIVESNSEVLGKRWRNRRQLTNSLSNRLRHEYLLQLKTVNQLRGVPTTPLKVGEVVILADDGKSRLNWERGVITECHTGRDGLIRSYSVKVPSGRILRRPIQLLISLEVAE
jgi:hypothetical protein